MAIEQGTLQDALKKIICLVGVFELLFVAVWRYNCARVYPARAEE